MDRQAGINTPPGETAQRISIIICPKWNHGKISFAMVNHKSTRNGIHKMSQTNMPLVLMVHRSELLQ